MTHLLAADIGGTKSDLAIFDLSQTPATPPLCRLRYDNSNFHDFDAILTEFLGTTDSPIPVYGCFGVAAVVHSGNAQLTNRAWLLNEKKLQKSFEFTKVTLINDLTAVCSGLPFLDETELLQIQRGRTAEQGIQAVIAPGTGLGEGFLIHSDACFVPQGSEGGHCDFAPLNREQSELLSYLQKRYNSVSYELLCSGIGIPNIFDFLASTDIARDPEWFIRIAKARDRTPLISEGAFAASPCPLCAKTFSLFLEILGAEAGNLALKTLCTGGLFIGGGILPRIAEHISFDSFLEAFTKKEKMASLMEAIPIHLILKKDAALLGAASYGFQLFTKE